MSKVGKIILGIVHWPIYLLCLCFGALSMPSGLGAVLLFLALFLTPKPIANMLGMFPWMRWVLLFFACMYLHYVTDENIRMGAYNTVQKIKFYQEILQSVKDFCVK